MKVIVSGCGKIGKTIIASMVKEKHSVIAIDCDPNVINNIVNTYDVIGICAKGVSSSELENAGVKGIDLFVAVTNSDETNIASCITAKKLGAKTAIARIRGIDYDEQSIEFIKKQLGISLIINPELLTAKYLFNIIHLPAATKVETFSSKNIEMIEYPIKDNFPFEGMMLKDLRSKINSTFLICAIKRNDNVFIPNGLTVIKKGDRIGIISTKSSTKELIKTFEDQKKSIKNVMILGGGQITYYLANMLIKNGINVKIFEKDLEVCEKLSEDLPSDCVIIHSDCMQHDTLKEEGISEMDAVVALTSTDETNIISSIYASNHKVPKVLSKLKSDHLRKIADQIGLDSYIATGDIVADIITSYARSIENSMGNNIETLYNLMNQDVEAIEFNVNDDFECINIPIKDIKLKDNILIAGIIRGNETIIPGGNDTIVPNDKVIIITHGQRLLDLSQIIK